MGIFGSEGMQAVMAADFGIYTFKCITRLLLVHGRWNYNRVLTVILFSIYKNLVLMLSLCQFTILSAYSGQTLYESYLMAGWNVFYTVLPLFVMGIIDEDLSDNVLLDYPDMYTAHHSPSKYHFDQLSRWCATAVFHSFVVFQNCGFFYYGSLELPVNELGGIVSYGTMVYGVLLMTVMSKSVLTMQPFFRWTKHHYASIILSIMLYFVFIAVYSRAYTSFHFDLLRDFSGIGAHVLGSTTFVLTLVIVPVFCFLVDLTLVYLERLYFPSFTQTLQDLDAERLTMGLTSQSQNPASPEVGPKDQMNPETSAQDELCRKLRKKQRLLLRSRSAKASMASNETPRGGSTNEESSVKCHPLTLEFMGNRNVKLEREYSDEFHRRESYRLQLIMRIIVILSPIYIAFEYFVEEQHILHFRLPLFFTALCYWRYTFSETFVRHYQLSILVPMLLGGMSFTMTITASGKFAITMFPIVLFSVLRVKFIYAIVIALANFGFYVLSLWSNMEDMFTFSCFMMFIIAFAAYSSYALQVAMRKDFLQHRRLAMEQHRHMAILDHMMPKHIATRLQRGDKLISQFEPNVTV